MPIRFLAALASLSVLHAAAPFTDDLAAAKARASEQHKDILVDFTGSDWCGWCVRLDTEVFGMPAFQAGAAPLFELVRLDFPQTPGKQSEEITARNKAWKSELKSSSFPDILLLDEKGRVFARTGYREGGAEPFLKHLEALRQGRIQRDAAMKKAEGATGSERAKHLDEALSALGNDEVLLTYYRAEISEILALDPQNEAGLQAKYKGISKRKQIEREINLLCTGDDGAAMLDKLKAYAAKTDIPVECQQYALYMAGAVACERFIKDPRQALDLIHESIAMAPESPLAKDELKQAKLRLERRLAKDAAKGNRAAGS